MSQECLQGLTLSMGVEGDSGDRVGIGDGEDEGLTMGEMGLCKYYQILK